MGTWSGRYKHPYKVWGIGGAGFRGLGLSWRSGVFWTGRDLCKVLLEGPSAF